MIPGTRRGQLITTFHYSLGMAWFSSIADHHLKMIYFTESLLDYFQLS